MLHRILHPVPPHKQKAKPIGIRYKLPLSLPSYKQVHSHTIFLQSKRRHRTKRVGVHVLQFLQKS